MKLITEKENIDSKISQPIHIQLHGTVPPEIGPIYIVKWHFCMRGVHSQLHGTVRPEIKPV